MNQNWIVENILNAFATWNDKLAELWSLVTMSPDAFKGGAVWAVIPLWLVTILGSLLITVLSFVMILTVYGSIAKVWTISILRAASLTAPERRMRS